MTQWTRCVMMLAILDDMMVQTLEAVVMAATMAMLLLTSVKDASV